MANQRIVAIVTALLLMSTTASAVQAASIEELRKIDAMVSTQDWAGLYSMVLANPRLISGNDPLSSELRTFMRQNSLGRIAGLAPATQSASNSPTPSAVPQSRTSSASIGDIY
jgi:hypothetical protein